MTYFAPRQGLFAVIMLVSMSLHLLFFVLGQEHTLSQQQQAIAQQKATLIAEEITIPLHAQDRVSVSVITSRYIKDEQVDFIGVYDSNDSLIVPVGKESPQSFTIKEPITLHNQVLGSVAVHAHTINRAEIISKNWLFLVAVFALHVFIYLSYGYVARPSKNMLAKIAEDMRLRLLNSNVLPASLPVSPPSPPLEPITHQDSPKHDGDDNVPEPDIPSSSSDIPAPISNNYIMIQIQFDDADGLMSTVSHHTKSAYFALCTQLLNKAVHELLQLPVVSGVSLFGIDDYSEQGAVVVLKADNRHAKVATAAMMLARLMILLNQIVYDKHRELKRFGLPVRAMVSDIDHKEHILQVAKKYKERILILVGETDLSQLSTYGELDKLINPTTIYERECRWLKAVSESTAKRIETVRDTVLLSD
ncbi:MAG: hypothetical protein Q3971_05525 [Moraxella sp.]|nr:hypothetical protein [Moraxella sp.]